MIVITSNTLFRVLSKTEKNHTLSSLTSRGRYRIHSDVFLKEVRWSKGTSMNGHSSVFAFHSIHQWHTSAGMASMQSWHLIYPTHFPNYKQWRLRSFQRVTPNRLYLDRKSMALKIPFLIVNNRKKKETALPDRFPFIIWMKDGNLLTSQYPRIQRAN